MRPAVRVAVVQIALLAGACHASEYYSVSFDPLYDHPLHDWASGLFDERWREKEVEAAIRRAECGDVLAQYRVGETYAAGAGVPRDAVRGYAWYAIAASNGHRLAAAARDRLAAEMTPGQIAEAKRLARDWRPAACRAGTAPASG